MCIMLEMERVTAQSDVTTYLLTEHKVWNLQKCLFFSGLDNDSSATVDCGNTGTGITIAISYLPDLSQWLEDQDKWQLNDDADCPPTFGSTNVTYGPFNGSDCGFLVSESGNLVFTFLINASKPREAVVLSHFYVIRCKYRVNGTVFSSFQPLHNLQSKDTRK